jgi:hypothetical protein
MNEIKYFKVFFTIQDDVTGDVRWVAGDVRLVPVVDRLYLNLSHATSAFSLAHQRSSSRLQHSVHSYISISFFLSQSTPPFQT